jgi:hypothetical protein
MRNVLLWSRATDQKILIAGGAACSLLLAAAIGSALPSPESVDGLPLLQGLITALMLIVVWSGFHVLRPSWYSPRWVVAEAIVVPLVWGLLVTVLGLYLGGMHSVRDIEMETFINQAIL